MDDEEEEFDYSWIKNYKETEEAYNLFYKSEVNNVELFFYYINEENHKERIHKERIHKERIHKARIHKAQIHKERIELIEKTDENGYLRKVIKKEHLLNKIEKMEKYQLIAAYKYTILAEPEDIVNELFTSEKNHFTQIKLDDGDIVFEKTIGFFQDLNALYLIFKQTKNTKTNKKTKKKDNRLLETTNIKTRKNKLKNII